ncbi:MAG: hypothetical protein V1888_01830 [archaeon]
MKLTKINYNSAIVFGVLSLVMYLFIGILQWSLRDILIAQGIPVSAIQTFVMAPIVGGAVGYFGMIVVIAIYNAVAMKFPISWEVKK